MPSQPPTEQMSSVQDSIPDLTCNEKWSSTRRQLFRSGAQEIFDRPDGEKTTQEKTCSVSVGRAIAAKFWEAVRTTGRFPHKRVQVKGNIQRGQHLSLVSTNLYYFNNLTSTSSLQIVTPLIILVNFLASA